MLFGSVADRLGVRGIATQTVFGVAVAALLAVEILILSSAPLPAYVLWGMLSLFGGLPALGFAIMSELFTKEIIGRISSALVMMNFGITFFVQSGMGFILSLWPHPSVGPPPRIAFEIAFAAPCALQVMAFAWFLWRGASRRKATAQALWLRTAAVEGDSEILPP